MLRIYLNISLVILLIIVVVLAANRFMSRNIKTRIEYTKSDTVRIYLRMVILCFVPILRWTMLVTMIRTLLATDDELLELLQQNGNEDDFYREDK